MTNDANKSRLREPPSSRKPLKRASAKGDDKAAAPLGYLAGVLARPARPSTSCGCSTHACAFMLLVFARVNRAFRLADGSEPLGGLQDFFAIRVAPHVSGISDDDELGTGPGLRELPCCREWRT